MNGAGRMNANRRPLSETEAFLTDVIVFQAQLDGAIQRCPDGNAVALDIMLRLHSQVSSVRVALEEVMKAFAGRN